MLDLLLDREVHDEEEDFTAVGSETMLGKLQDAMLSLRQRGVGESKLVIENQDDSIRVHSCHSPVREVEVLRDHDHDVPWLKGGIVVQPRQQMVAEHFHLADRTVARMDADRIILILDHQLRLANASLPE